MIGEFATLVFAGSETTASALGWLVFLLATHAELQEELRAEALAADKSAAAVTLERLPRLAAFVNEGLRIFPPIPFVSRIAAEADELGGAAVEPGDKILMSIVGLHHDTAVWSSPSKFTPERFGTLSAEQRASFIPFSDGPRTCGGMRFAMTEIAAALTMILGRVRLGLPTDRLVEFAWHISLRRAGGHRIPVAAL